jgi:hypothetical protein
MAISYSPNLYSGTLYQEIFQEIFFANKTVRDGYVRLIDNVKDATLLTSLSSTTALKDYQAEPTTSTSLTPSDTSLAPVQVMLYEEFDPNVLRGSRFAVDMAAGSFNMMSNEFDRAIMEHFAGKFGQAIERAIWQNVKTADKTAVAASGTLNADVKRGIGQSDALVSVNGLWAKATFTSAIAATTVKIASKSTDVATAFANLLSTCPTESVMREDFTIFAPHAYYQAILAKNSAETYRDKFVVIPETKEVFYQGIPVKFVPLTYTTTTAAACLIAGPANDLVVGADLFSDSGIVEIGKKFNYGDTMFVKAKFSLDTAVMFPQNFTVQCNY